MLRFVSLVFFSLLLAGAASAHRIGVPLTTMQWNAAEQAWDIMHRLSVHDVDSHFTGGRANDGLYTTGSGIEELGHYVAGKFHISGHDIDLTYIGAEVDGDQVWVYFELRAPAQTVQIDSDILLGDGETSFTVVNVKRTEGVQSLMFGPRDGAQSVSLIPPPD